MALSINYPDKILPGLWQSYTITSDEGPPEGDVLLEGRAIERRIIPLRGSSWKVSFLIPADAAGKSLTLKFHNAAAAVEEAKVVEKA